MKARIVVIALVLMGLLGVAWLLSSPSRDSNPDAAAPNPDDTRTGVVGADPGSPDAPGGQTQGQIETHAFEGNTKDALPTDDLTRLSGIVYDSERLPCEGVGIKVNLALWDGSRPKRGFAVIHRLSGTAPDGTPSVKTDQDGLFTLAVPTAELRELGVGKPGNPADAIFSVTATLPPERTGMRAVPPSEMHLASATSTVPLGQSRHIEINMGAGDVPSVETLIQLEDGRPLAGIRVAIRARSGETTSVTLLTDQNGRCRLTGLQQRAAKLRGHHAPLYSVNPRRGEVIEAAQKLLPRAKVTLMPHSQMFREKELVELARRGAPVKYTATVIGYEDWVRIYLTNNGRHRSTPSIHYNVLTDARRPHRPGRPGPLATGRHLVWTQMAFRQPLPARLELMDTEAGEVAHLPLKKHERDGFLEYEATVDEPDWSPGVIVRGRIVGHDGAPIKTQGGDYVMFSRKLHDEPRGVADVEVQINPPNPPRPPPGEFRICLFPQSRYQMWLGWGFANRPKKTITVDTGSSGGTVELGDVRMDLFHPKRKGR